ncbi:MAG: cupin domain-containing protein [bacterium]|nr:cupin domain-containing protein [bacterium]
MSDKSYPYKATIADLLARIGSGYPAPFHEPCTSREKTVLGDAVGLSQFGVNLLVLNHGDWSAQRHWHQNEDEFVYILEGEVTLIIDEGESLLKAGDIAGFPAGQSNGHHLVNKSTAIAKVFEVGTRCQADVVDYPDVDMTAKKEEAKYRFLYNNGDPYE